MKGGTRYVNAGHSAYEIDRGLEGGVGREEDEACQPRMVIQYISFP